LLSIADAEKQMSKSKIALTLVAMLACCGTPAVALDLGASAPAGARLESGYLHNVWYDGRDDDRDFPTNGFFPGDFAANPAAAWVGAAGLFGSNPSRGPGYDPPYVVYRVQPDPAACVGRRPSYRRLHRC
jgi:hypothetical protein